MPLDETTDRDPQLDSWLCERKKPVSMPSAAFQKAADESRQLKAKPSNDELLEVSPTVNASNGFLHVKEKEVETKRTTFG